LAKKFLVALINPIWSPFRFFRIDETTPTWIREIICNGSVRLAETWLKLAEKHFLAEMV